jgi:NADPH2:quinone reductase
MILRRTAWGQAVSIGSPEVATLHLLTQVSSMRAVICREYGPAEKLEVAEVPAPQPGELEVLVDVHAAAVNFPDLLIIQNRYQLSVAPPFTPGSELAGIVRAVGPGVEDIAPGDRVCGQVLIGAFAEQAILPAAMVNRLPKEIDLKAAAAFGVVYNTAYQALRSAAQLRTGETLLVLGAAGGVGLATVDIGRILGARVIAAASSAEKLAVCRSYGAAETIDYQAENLKERLKALTGGRGVDVVIDPVGGELAEQAIRATGWRGRYVTVGYASGTIPRIPVNLLLLKGCSLVGFNLAPFMMNEPEEAARCRRELFQLLVNGHIKPHVAAVYRLADVARALNDVAERRVIGKVVIDPTI